MFYCWRYYQSLTVSSVVGAPWRCGVLTTLGGIAGMWLGRLLGREHASTPQSGVEAPRLLKRSFPRSYYCCCCGGGGVYDVCVYPYAPTIHAPNLGARSPESKLPARRSTLALCRCTGPYQLTLSKHHETCSTCKTGTSNTVSMNCNWRISVVC